MNPRGASALVSAAVLAVAGCGGGGGGGGTGSVTVTSANARQVASVAVDSAQGLIDVTSSGTDVFGSRVPGLGDHGAARFDLARFLHRRLDGMFSGRDVRRAIRTETDNCQGGGTVTEIWNDDDDDGEVSTGDTFELQLAGCSDGDGLTLTGRILVDQLVVSGNPGTDSFSLALRVTFDRLQVVDQSESVTINGVIGTSLARNGSTITLRIDVAASVADSKTNLLAGTKIDYVVDDITDEYSIRADGAVADATLGGTITFSTTAPFQGRGDQFPSSGILFVRGSGGTSVRVVTLDAQRVRLEVDTDGDGTADETFTVRWQDLLDD